MLTPDPGTYPVLHRAYQNQIKIDRTWIEMPNGDRNPAQIFREPFRYKLDHSDLQKEADGALERMKADLEQAFIHGVPQAFKSYPLTPSTLGGTRYWLGRDLASDDEIAIAVLYPLTVRLAIGELDPFNDNLQHGEWITEASLRVKAAPTDDEKE